MLNLLKKLFQKNKDICKNCVWWASEEYNNKKIFSKNIRFCDLDKKYHRKGYSCNNFLKEKFKADENSTTLESNFDLEVELERDSNGKLPKS